MAKAETTNIKSKAAQIKLNATAAITVAVALGFLGAALSLAGYIHLNQTSNEVFAALIGLTGIGKLLQNVR